MSKAFDPSGWGSGDMQVATKTATSKSVIDSVFGVPALTLNDLYNSVCSFENKSGIYMGETKHLIQDAEDARILGVDWSMFGDKIIESIISLTRVQYKLSGFDLESMARRVFVDEPKSEKTLSEVFA